MRSKVASSKLHLGDPSCQISFEKLIPTLAVAFRPECRQDVYRSRSPVEAGGDRLIDLQCIHQRDGIDRERRLLAVPECSLVRNRVARE